MKAERVEGKESNPNLNPNTMFASSTPPLHHHHHQNLNTFRPPHSSFLHLPPPPHFNSEEEDSGGQAPSPSLSGKRPAESGGGDGATIEVSRRLRGRPPGSKNKPKPPVIITRESPHPPMSPYVLELSSGTDVIDALSVFCRRRGLGLAVLAGSGAVANVTFRQPTSTAAHGATVTFHGRFDILSISATFLPPPPSTTSSQSQQLPPPTSTAGSGFTISLAGPQGQIVGGLVSGPLLAAGTVYVIAASFDNPSYHRLPAEDEMGSSVSGSACEGQSPPTRTGDDGGSHHHTGEMSIYGSGGHQLGSDVVWDPTATRQQPPPHF